RMFFDQPVCLKPRQRLADRATRHVKPGRKLVLAGKAAARRESSADDLCREQRRDPRVLDLYRHVRHHNGHHRLTRSSPSGAVDMVTMRRKLRSGTASSGSAVTLELNGANVIEAAERKGHPRTLFWPWFAANVSVLGLSYGAFLLGFGIGFWQAVVAGLIGIVLSFLLVGFVSLAGKRGSAPTMILSRAAFGVRGNALPAAVSYLLLVGWEIVLVALATLATATVFGRLGWGSGNAVKVIAFIVVIAIIIASGMLGFDVIMKVQAVIT